MFQMSKKTTTAFTQLSKAAEPITRLEGSLAHKIKDAAEKVYHTLEDDLVKAVAAGDLTKPQGQKIFDKVIKVTNAIEEHCRKITKEEGKISELMEDFEGLYVG